MRRISSEHSEFEIGRVKFVVLDEDSKNLPEYHRYFSHARELLSSKGFGKLWYGLVFLRDKLEPLNEVEVQAYLAHGYKRNFIAHRAGYYTSGTDTIAFTMPVTGYLTTAMVHECGHRFWYQVMSQGQRARFEELIQFTRPGSVYVPTMVGDQVTEETKAKVLQLGLPLRDLIKKFGSSKLRWFGDIIKQFDEPLYNAGNEYARSFVDAVYMPGVYPILTPHTKALFDGALEAAQTLRRHTYKMDQELRDAVNSLPDSSYPDLRKTFKVLQAKWIAEALKLLNNAEKSALDYIQAGVEAHNQKELEKVTEYGKPITSGGTIAPVSDYGQSNIREAFAEVFTHYVMEKDMTRPQLESFRSVLAATVTASPQRIASRFLAGFITNAAERQ